LIAIKTKEKYNYNITLYHIKLLYDHIKLQYFIFPNLQTSINIPSFFDNHISVRNHLLQLASYQKRHLTFVFPFPYRYYEHYSLP